MRERRYRGWRDRGGFHVDVIDAAGKARPLTNVANHRSGRWEWDTASPRLSELSMSILADAMGEEPTLADIRNGTLTCVQLAEDFAWELVAIVHGSHWEVGIHQVMRYIHAQHHPDNIIALRAG